MVCLYFLFLPFCLMIDTGIGLCYNDLKRIVGTTMPANGPQVFTLIETGVCEYETDYQERL